MDIKGVNFDGLISMVQRDMEKVKTQTEKSGIILNSYGVYEPAPAVTRETYKKVISEITPWYENIPQKDNKAELLARSKEKVSTERAVKYFEKALSAGFMKEADNRVGYDWLYNGGSKVSLAYFLKKIYNPDGYTQTPFQNLERLFSVKRLDKSTYALMGRDNKLKWAKNIDELFEEE